jgi:hypothetical protein
VSAVVRVHERGSRGGWLRTPGSRRSIVTGLPQGEASTPPQNLVECDLHPLHPPPQEAWPEFPEELSRGSC